jgi:hypothetical protein
VPLDTTHLHGLTEDLYLKESEKAVKAGSPLAAFLDAILQRTFKRLHSLIAQGRESDIVEMHMHDPLCIYYAMLDNEERKGWVVERNVDVRVECTGTWTRGMTLLDQRSRRPIAEKKSTQTSEDEIEGGEDTAGGDYQGVDDDEGGWRGGTGNRLDVVWGSSVKEGLAGNLKTVETMSKLIWGFE